MKIKQRDITDCGAACLGAVSSYYKLQIPISRIRQIAGTDKKGTNVYGLVQAAEKLDFTAKGVKGNKESLSEIPLPAIAHLIVKEQLHHYVVITKVKGEHITVMDPAYGEYKKMSITEFEKEWTGVLVLLVPKEGEFKTGKQTTSVGKRFWELVKPHKTILTQALFGAVVYTLIGLTTSIYIQKITDYVLVDGNKNLLNLLSIAMVILLIVQIFIGATKSIYTIRTGQKIDAQLILGYYKHLLDLPQQFFDTMRVGEIISRINDAVKIRAFINDVAITIFVNVLIVCLSFAIMFAYYWKLALIMLLVIPIYLAIYLVINKLNKKQERKVMEKAAELENQLVESVTAVRTIKQFGLEDFANLKTETRFVGLLQTVYQSAMNSIFSANSSEFISRLFTIILLWSGSYFVIDQSITPGELLSFYALVGYFTSPIAQLIGANKSIQNALIAADRLFEIIDLEIEETQNKLELTNELIGDITLKELSFTYGTRAEVFTKLNLSLKKGEITAIIGESGSGKTTITALLQKLYPLNSGSIFIGDYNLDHISNKSLRKQIGVVPQKLDLFAGNVVENIAIGQFEPDMKTVIDICTQLGILEFIEQLPQGFNTYLGENGASLSGGQKQRIAIARAMYKNPSILIMDEATSSLDSVSEDFVQKTIHRLKNEGKTILLIAHRLSTVVDADKILVLEKGKLIEEGSHTQLYQQKGKYYEMWQKQIPKFSE
jgi:ATP-binding cassette subfamily B protein